MVVYTENPEESSNKLYFFILEINTWTPFTITQKKKQKQKTNTQPPQHLDVNLTTHIWDLYVENYIMLMKEIKNLNK